MLSPSLSHCFCFPFVLWGRGSAVVVVVVCAVTWWWCAALVSWWCTVCYCTVWCVCCEWRWCEWCVMVSSLVFFALFLLCLLLLAFLSFFLVLVFGVVRAQLCEHARYPRTPLCSSCCVSRLVFFFVPLSSSLFRFSLCLVFPFVGMAVGSPCVTVLCWHDSNWESVSLVIVFLVVACSAFAVSAVASTAVAFGAQYSAVVWVVGSS